MIMAKHRMKKRDLSIIVFIVLCFCYMIPNYAQYQVSPLGPQLMEMYTLELGQLSSLFSAPMIPAIFFSLVGGLLIDKFGPKNVIGIGLIITSAGCIFRIFSYSFASLFVCMMLTGLTACFITAGAGKIIGSLYGTENVPAKMGILMAASTGSMTIANLTTAYFSSIQGAFIFTAAISCTGTVLWFFFIKNPQDKTEEAANPSGPNMKTCLKTVLKERGVWLVSMALFFVMAANVVMGSFLPTALANRGIDAKTAGMMAAFYTLGNLLGCFAAPAAIKLFGSQKITLLLFSILSAIGVIFAWTVPTIPLLAMALMLTGIFLGGTIPNLMGLPVQLPQIGPLYAGTAGGVVGTIQIFGAILIPSHVIAPIAGGNFHTLFFLGGVCMLFTCLLTIMIKNIK